MPRIGVAILLCAAFFSGCSRQTGVPIGADRQSSKQSLPFGGASEKTGISPTGKLVPSPVPGGTAITVRLKGPLSSASALSGDSFDAILDESLTAEGQTIVPRGTIVRGKVVEANASKNLQDPGYLRLTLTKIFINGKSYVLQTSSIFVKGGPQRRKGALIGTSAGASRQDVGIAPEHRLTFRLNQPLSPQD